MKDLQHDVILEVAQKLDLVHFETKKYHTDMVPTSPSAITRNKIEKAPGLVEFMIEYVSRIIITIKALDTKILKSSHKEIINNFVSHRSWPKNLVSCTNFRTLSNNELVSKLTERVDDIIFDAYHFSEYKNASSEKEICNTFEHAKVLSKKVKKAIKKLKQPVFIKRRFG